MIISYIEQNKRVERNQITQLNLLKMKYKCSECELAVIVLEGEEPIKACTCEAPIIAEISATAIGVSNLN
jgi:hypothetical protein